MTHSFLIRPEAMPDLRFELSSNGNGIRISGIKTKTPNHYDLVFKTADELEEFKQLYGIELLPFPPESYRKVLQACNVPNDKISHSRWQMLMGTQKYLEYIQEMGEDFSKKLNTAHKKYSYWSSHRPCTANHYNLAGFFKDRSGFRYYQDQIHIDPKTLKKCYDDASLAQKSLLKEADGIPLANYLNDPASTIRVGSPEYTFTNTVTGRMLVSKGLNILLLKKEYRNIFRPSAPDRCLKMVDFASLEPRVLLSLTKPSLIGRVPQDIYTHILTELGLEKTTSRAVAKTAVLAILYGQKEETTVRELKPHMSKPEDFLAAVRDYFGVDEFEAELRESFLKGNGKYIYNIYGRPIRVEEGKIHSLLNYVVQSTAVNVALNGFNQLIDKALEVGIRGIRPIFLIHDAVVMEIPTTQEKKFADLVSKPLTDIPKFTGVNFYLTCEDFG